jgi:hypothetical protein
MVPGLLAQSLSNTQAKAGIEVRQSMVTTISLRIALPSWNPLKNHTAECRN